ncbi:hypothetical protein HMI56_001658 [Coelomomyces lativittatus]|nr:hypothetical protein HMI56_001658 [Coelomomyces lativittatus]
MSQPPPSSSSSSSSPSFPTSPLLSSTSSSSSSTTTPRRENIVDISELEVPQLESIHQQLQEELQVLTQSYAQLKQVQLKFLNCDETLASLMECKQGQEGHGFFDGFKIKDTVFICLIYISKESMNSYRNSK